MLLKNEIENNKIRLKEDRSQSILVVDGHREDLTHTTEIIKCSGFKQILTASNISEAIQSLQVNKIDLVICEYSLPDDSSLSLLYYTKIIDSLIPIIMVGKEVSTLKVVESMREGALDFIFKPLGDKKLLFAMTRALSKRQSWIKNRQTDEDFLKEVEQLTEIRDENLDHLSSLGARAQEIMHDLRNPLTVVKMYADMLHANAKVLESDKVETMGKGIIKAALRIEELSKSVLTKRKHSREVSQEVVDLNKAAQRSIKVCNLTKKNSEITISLTQPENSLPVKCNQGALMRILVNLIENAIDAQHPSKPGEIELTVGTFEEKSKVYGKISVSDKGAGISPDIKKKLFTRGSTTKEKGSGIGLHTSRNRMREMSGDLVLENDANPTLFSIYLPLFEN